MIGKHLAARIAGAALAFGLIAAHAEAKTGHCVTSRMAYAIAKAELHTVSTSFSNVADAEVAFTQHGDQPGCVIVSFSAAVSGEPSVVVRAVLDPQVATQTVSFPPYVTFTVGTLSIPQVNSFDFVFPRVTPGQHKIKIHWSVGGKNGSVFMYERSTIVHHR